MLKGVTKTIENETKEQQGGFLSMLLATLGASLLGNLWTGKGIVRAGSGNDKWKGIVRAGSGKQLDFFEIQKYENEPKFNGVFFKK